MLACHTHSLFSAMSIHVSCSFSNFIIFSSWLYSRFIVINGLQVISLNNIFLLNCLQSRSFSFWLSPVYQLFPFRTVLLRVKTIESKDVQRNLVLKIVEGNINLTYWMGNKYLLCSKCLYINMKRLNPVEKLWLYMQKESRRKRFGNERQFGLFC